MNDENNKKKKDKYHLFSVILLLFEIMVNKYIKMSKKKMKSFINLIPIFTVPLSNTACAVPNK